MIRMFALAASAGLILSPLGKATAESHDTYVVEQSTSALSERIAHTKEVVSAYSQNNQNVLITLHNFLSRLQTSYEHGEGMIITDIFRILDGIEFAAIKHQHQVRKSVSATPYIIHPVGVADNLLTLGGVRDPDILIGALLHDTVEDTDTSFEEVNAAFGPRVEGFVREVTDDKSLPKAERKALQIAHAPHKSAGAAQIKLADKLYNLNDMATSPPPGWERERIDAYFDWAEKVVHALPWVNSPLLQAVDQTIARYRSSN